MGKVWQTANVKDNVLTQDQTYKKGQVTRSQAWLGNVCNRINNINHNAKKVYVHSHTHTKKLTGIIF